MPFMLRSNTAIVVEAKDILFTAGVRKDLDDLARLAGAERSVQKLGNPSRSAVIANNTVEGLTLVGQFVGGGGVPRGVGVGVFLGWRSFHSCFEYINIQ